MSLRNLLLVAGIVTTVIAIVVYKGKDLSDKLLPTGDMVETSRLPDTSPSISPEPIKGRPRIDIATTKGNFTIEVRPDLAPQTVVNFLTKWNNQYCSTLTFHRVEDWVIQGCDPLGNGRGGATNLPTETSSESFLAGSVGVARNVTPTTLSNDSQFFITKRDATFLDGEYTYFGKIVSGMNVVNQIAVGDKIISSTILSK